MLGLALPGGRLALTNGLRWLRPKLVCAGAWNGDKMLLSRDYSQLWNWEESGMQKNADWDQKTSSSFAVLGCMILDKLFCLFLVSVSLTENRGGWLWPWSSHCCVQIAADFMAVPRGASRTRLPRSFSPLHPVNWQVLSAHALGSWCPGDLFLILRSDSLWTTDFDFGLPTRVLSTLRTVKLLQGKKPLQWGILPQVTHAEHMQRKPCSLCKYSNATTALFQESMPFSENRSINEKCQL